MLKIYGASDDLVEVEGHISGEIGCYKSPVVLRIGSVESGVGCYVVMRYASTVEDKISGRLVSPCWSAEIVMMADDNDEGVPLPPGMRLEHEGYTVVVIIPGNLPCVRVTGGGLLEVIR